MLQTSFDPSLEKAITTAHEHEHPVWRKPLWIVWKITTGSDGIQEFPAIDSVCDSEDSCRYHLGALKETNANNNLVIFVERIPANHRFASSLEQHFTDSSLTTVRQMMQATLNEKETGRYEYKREGD